MTVRLIVDRAGPAMTIQDFGRPGFMARGLSPGGAADTLALMEGAALLGQAQPGAAIEMASLGGDFRVSEPTRIALTGAPMTARIDGEPIAWTATHILQPEQKLTIGSVVNGVYGYLHFAGGVTTAPILSSRSTHLNARIGRRLAAGDEVPIGPDRHLSGTSVTLDVDDRFRGGTVRVMPSAQTHRFSDKELSRFEDTHFWRTPRGNRQGVELAFDGAPFASDDQLSILSEPMVAGDVQMTGDGVPFVLLPECQTTGGYPRIGTVVPLDLPTIAQAGQKANIRFRFTSFDEEKRRHAPPETRLARLKEKVRPLLRNPAAIRNLLSYQLIGGVVSATDS